MKSLFLAFIIVTVHINLNAQILSPETMVSAGSTDSTEYAQINWTLGGWYHAKTLDEGETVIITQGFIQPILSLATVNKYVDKDNNLSVKVFPNPVKQNLNIKFDSKNNEDLIIQLYNISGKQILTKILKNKNKTETINFEKYNNGVYFLKTISSDGKYIENFKIIFQN